MRAFKTKFVAAALAAALAVPLSANAALVLQLESGGDTKTIYDGGVGDTFGTSGIVGFVGTVGGWVVNVSTAFGNEVTSFFGTHLNSVNMSGYGATPLTVRMTETGLNFGMPSGTLLPINGGIGGVTGGQVSFGLFADDGNAEFGKTSTLWAGTASGGAFSATGGSYMTTSDPFSLTLEVTMNHGGKSAITSFDIEGRVHEPGTLALVGAALLGLGALTRRRKV